MTFVVIQSVPLGRETRDALRSVVGEVIAHNNNSLHRDIDTYVRANVFEFILNMGNSWLNIPDQLGSPLVNSPEEIELTRTPGALRRNFGEFLPPWPDDPSQYPLDCWIKAPGRAGRGKYHKAVDYPLVLPNEWDCQKHIEGQEYRVITVGHRAVQGFIRDGSNQARRYSWTGLTNTPDKVLDTAREAAKRLSHNNLRAWDLITEIGTGNVYILEGNSSPGMNAATAERVATEIRRQVEEGRIT